jgi:hypothetical protein
MLPGGNHMAKFNVVLMFFGGPKGIDEVTKQVVADTKELAITTAKALVEKELRSKYVVFFSSEALPL